MAEFISAPLALAAEQFAKLPGIGIKTAQRLAYYMLNLPQHEVEEFASALVQARSGVQLCRCCQNFTDREVCEICSDDNRDKGVICVVESPKDVSAFERSGGYEGVYHVLHGLISPMDGIGPDQLTIKELLGRIAKGDVSEVIMATNPTVEGEATAMYIAKLLKPLGVKVSRLAYGIPVGGNLEYADEVTLWRAMEGRSEL